jgi:hypothetical protein
MTLVIKIHQNNNKKHINFFGRDRDLSIYFGRGAEFLLLLFFTPFFFFFFFFLRKWGGPWPQPVPPSLRLWLEGDCLEVAQAINSEEVAWGQYGPLINESKQFLEQLQNWKLVHVPRTCNVVAHKLARLALMYSDELIWHGETPSCISGDITAEAGLLS